MNPSVEIDQYPTKLMHTCVRIYGSLVWQPHLLPMLSQTLSSTSPHYFLSPVLSHFDIGQ